MIASSSASNKVLVGLAALTLFGGAACDTREPDPYAGTTSMAVTLMDVPDNGSDHRLPDSFKSVKISVQAIDDQGNPDSGFNADVDVYAQYLGTITPPAQMLHMVDGAGSMTVSVPEAFGSTYLWVEDANDMDGARTPTYATGTSNVMWFRDPFIEDTELPDLNNPATWLTDDLLEGKQVTVTRSKHGASGKIVVTGVFVDGCSVSDVDCTTRPCVADPFNHVFVYSFGAPRDTTGRLAEVGDVVDTVGGGVGEFNGFTELNFPVFTLDDADPDESLVPKPVVIQSDWLKNATSASGMLNMEKVESGLIEVDGATVCQLDSDYTTFSQWKLDVGLGCAFPINVISKGQVPSVDPTTLVGKKMTKVVGMLKAVNIGSFNVWILLPRRASDIVPAN